MLGELSDGGLLLIFQSYSEYDAEHPMGSGCTMLPKPHRKVTCCPKAVSRATKTIKSDMEKRPLNAGQAAFCEKKRQKRIALFSPMKGKGAMSKADMAKFLGVSLSSAGSQAENLCSDGLMKRTKLSYCLVMYEWIAP